MSTSIGLKAQKKALRKAMAVTLGSLPTSSVEEQSNSVRDAVLSLEAFKRSKNVSCYLGMPSGELDTTVLAREIVKLGKTLFVPQIDATMNRMRFLQIHGLADLDALPRGLWGIREPGVSYDGVARRDVLDQDSENLDVILVPGVAFDRSLSRLGHGKGYYDRFIASYVASGRPKPLLVALSLKEQLLDEGKVPVGELDWKMDVVVTAESALR